ncbi:hypothetical protein DdX_13382 [Ditylenchus destructor]|uniref:Uncharacterized protein n=1 Tax=Ditylenchus destructor TaxID=166010 RepID=A0AAD4MYW5_9BILA|nr:hypothetical protein DdX_13382 [Ditylenchus destructor]
MAQMVMVLMIVPVYDHKKNEERHLIVPIGLPESSPPLFPFVSPHFYALSAQQDAFVVVISVARSLTRQSFGFSSHFVTHSHFLGHTHRVRDTPIANEEREECNSTQSVPQ